MLNWTEKKLIDLGNFLKKYIYPFTTAFFAILNYVKMNQILRENSHHNWAVFGLILSVIYIFFTLGFGIYLIIIEVRKG